MQLLIVVLAVAAISRSGDQLDIVDAAGLWQFGGVGFAPRQAGVDHRVDDTRLPLGAVIEVNIHDVGIERIEPRLDALTGQMRRRLVEPALQQEGRVTADRAYYPIEEETAHIGCRRDLPDLFDVALPTQQRGGAQGAVFGDVVAVVDPGP